MGRRASNGGAASPAPATESTSRRRSGRESKPVVALAPTEVPTAARAARSTSKTPGKSAGKSASGKKKRSSTGEDVFDFENEPEAVIPTGGAAPATPARRRPRDASSVVSVHRDTPAAHRPSAVAGTDARKTIRQRTPIERTLAAVATPPRRPSSLSRRALTPPRFGTDDADHDDANHFHNLTHTLSPIVVRAAPTVSDSPPPADVWARVLQKDTANVVAAPVAGGAAWNSILVTPVHPSTKKRALATPTSTQRGSRLELESDAGDERSEATSSPVKRRKTTTSSIASASPAIGRRSSRLEGTPRKNMKEPTEEEFAPESDEEVDQDEDMAEAIGHSSTASSSRRGRPRGPAVRISDKPVEDTRGVIAKFDAFFKSLDAVPLKKLVEIRPQRPEPART